MGERYNPWEHAAALEVRILFRDLPEEIWGHYHLPSRTVVLGRHLVQCERRATLAHELVHVERRDGCQQSERVELEVHQVAARRLITLDMLCDAAAWAGGVDLGAIAEECWVDDETVRVRLATLTDEERASVARRHARRSA